MESARSALHSAAPAPAIRTAQPACDVPAVLCLRGSVSGGTSDGHIVLAGLGLSQGDTSGDATPLYSALGVSEAEMDLKEPFAVPGSLSLLSGSLLDPIAFIDPMARSGRFAQICVSRGSLVTETIKRPPAMQETCVQFPGGEDPLEEDMAPHSSILAWRIPWTEEPGGLRSVGSQSQTRLSDFTFTFKCVQ